MTVCGEADTCFWRVSRERAWLGSMVLAGSNSVVVLGGDLVLVVRCVSGDCYLLLEGVQVGPEEAVLLGELAVQLLLDAQGSPAVLLSRANARHLQLQLRQEILAPPRLHMARGHTGSEVKGQG